MIELIIKEFELDDVIKNMSISIIVMNESICDIGRVLNIWNIVSGILVKFFLFSIFILLIICLIVILL